MDLSLLTTLWHAIRQAMRLNPEIFIETAQAPRGIYLALTVVGLAGLSETIGQSMILFVNQIRPKRFIPAVLIGVVSYIIGYLLWTTSVYFVTRFAFQATATWLTIAAVVGLAYAPQILSFFELIPYFGNAFGILLSLWTMVAVVVAMVFGLDLTLWQAVIAAGLGWLLLQLLRRTVGIPVNSIWHWFRTRAIGVRLQYNPGDVRQLRRRAELWLNLDSAAASEEEELDSAENATSADYYTSKDDTNGSRQSGTQPRMYDRADVDNHVN